MENQKMGAHFFENMARRAIFRARRALFGPHGPMGPIYIYLFGPLGPIYISLGPLGPLIYLFWAPGAHIYLKTPDKPACRLLCSSRPCMALALLAPLVGCWVSRSTRSIRCSGEATAAVFLVVSIQFGNVYLRQMRN